MRVAVTGASGFVGRHVVRELLAAGHAVLPLGRRSSDASTSDLPGYRQWDITRPLDDAPDVDAVVHGAAVVGDWGDEALFHAVNVEGTRHVLAAFPRARIVHLSSSSVYSDHVRTVQVREDAPIGDCAHSIYGRTKAAAERLVLSMRPDAVVLRPHIVYGPGDTTLLPRLLAARRFGRLVLPGHGRNLVSITNVANLVHAVMQGLERRDASGVFNICDAESVRVDTLVRHVLRRTGTPEDVAYLPAPLAHTLAAALEAAWRLGRFGGSPPLTRYVVKHLSVEHTLDLTRARAMLGYAPRRGLDDAIFS